MPGFSAGPARRGRLMIDPNIRPGFVADADRYRRRLDAMLARADIVKLSAEDLDWLQPGPAERLDKLATLPGAAGRLSILTDGARGATALPPAGGAPIRVPARPVARVADTVGAGDSFNAGVLAGLWRQGAPRPRGDPRPGPGRHKGRARFRCPGRGGDRRPPRRRPALGGGTWRIAPPCRAHGHPRRHGWPRVDR
jgi:hypothetical protein